jgi:acyl-CoA thioester hydrolase
MDLSTLPITHQATVPADYLDEMGHMNVMWYTHLFDLATWHLFASFGMDLGYFEGQNAGAFALEQHTRYLAEVRLEQSITICSRILGRSTKRIHFMHFMCLDGLDALAATTELVGIHIDRLTRRSSPLPEAVAARLDRLLVKHQELAWDAPICGVMGP